MAATTGKKSFLPNASVMRGSNAFENGVTYCPLQRVQAGREGEREDREDGDRGRRWDATLAAIREVP